MNSIPIPTRVSKPKYRLSPRTLLIFCLFASVAIYTGYRTKDLVGGPVISVASPQNGVTLNDDFLTIEGEAKRIAHLFLNHRRIFTDERGRFREKILLADGYNVISLEASDKFGRSTRQTLELVYRQPI